MRAFAERRVNVLHDALGELLVVDVGDVVELESGRTFRGDHKFAAHREAHNLRGHSAMGDGESAATFLELIVSLGIEDFFEAAADHRLRLAPLPVFSSTSNIASLVKHGVETRGCWWTTLLRSPSLALTMVELAGRKGQTVLPWL